MPVIREVHPVLAAREVALSVAFYQQLGFRLLFQTGPGEVGYAVLRSGSVELHLQWADSGQWVDGLDRPVYRFLVDDVDALFAQWQSSGALPEPRALHRSPYATPADTPWGTREFHVHDPGGNGLQFYRDRAS